MADYPYSFSAVDLIRRLGGPSGLRQILMNHGNAVKTKTIQKWRERNSLPSWVIAHILMYFLEKGSLEDIVDHIVVEGCSVEQKVNHDNSSR